MPASLGPIATAIPTGTTYVVTNTNASDAGSLPHAINIANANPGKDTIVFNIPGTGPHTITLPSGLGGVYDPVIIDGATQPSYPISGTGAPVIILDGVDGQRGIYIEGGDTTIQGLCFIRFSVGIGIGIDNDGGNTIQGNYIGTNISGTAALGNGVGV
ncbi:MAG TPA: hypothetical protein VFG99_03735, partial [Chloroflexia bacterium]|nr:hypothetical protein [Chloroflexia bacterium]